MIVVNECLLVEGHDRGVILQGARTSRAITHLCVCSMARTLFRRLMYRSSRNEFCSQILVDDFLGNGDTGHPGGESQHVHIIVFHGLMSGVRVTGLGAADTVELVGSDGGACSRPAHDDAPVGLTVQYGSADRRGKIGVVD